METINKLSLKYRICSFFGLGTHSKFTFLLNFVIISYDKIQYCILSLNIQMQLTCGYWCPLMLCFVIVCMCPCCWDTFSLHVNLKPGVCFCWLLYYDFSVAASLDLSSTLDGKWHCPSCLKMPQKEKYVGHNGNVYVVGRIPGVDPIEERLKQHVPNVKTLEIDAGVCVFCRLVM